MAIIPEFLITGFKVAPIPFIGERLDAALPKFITEGMNVQFYFGGTSLLIVVGVVPENLSVGLDLTPAVAGGRDAAVRTRTSRTPSALVSPGPSSSP